MYTSVLTADAVPWSGLREGRGRGFGGHSHGRRMVLWDLMLEAENAAAAKISANTVEAVDLPCLSSTTPGIIPRGIDGQERIIHNRLRRKGASSLHRFFVLLMGVCILFYCFFVKLCAIKLV